MTLIGLVSSFIANAPQLATYRYTLYAVDIPYPSISRMPFIKVEYTVYDIRYTVYGVLSSVLYAGLETFHILENASGMSNGLEEFCEFLAKGQRPSSIRLE